MTLPGAGVPAQTACPDSNMHHQRQPVLLLCCFHSCRCRRQLASAEQMEEFIYAVMELAKGQAEGAQQLSALQQAQQA